MIPGWDAEGVRGAPLPWGCALHGPGPLLRDMDPAGSALLCVLCSAVRLEKGAALMSLLCVI